MYPLFLDPDPPAGGGGGEQQRQIQTESPARRANTLVDRLIARHGSAEAALASLAATNVTLEDEAVTSRNEVRRLTGLVPDPEKVVVLPKDRVETFNKFEALKLKPEDVTALQTEIAKLKGDVHSFNVRTLAQKHAAASGLDPEATADLIASKQLHAEPRKIDVEREKNGKKEKVAVEVLHVRPAADEKAALQPITEYAKTLAAFEQRALMAVASSSSDKKTETAAATATGTLYPDQQSAAETAQEKPGATVLSQTRSRYPTPSELRKAKQEPAHAS